MKSNADVVLASIHLQTLCYSVRISHDKWQGSITREAWNKLSPVNSESMLRALPVTGFYKAILQIPWVTVKPGQAFPSLTN